VVPLEPTNENGLVKLAANLRCMVALVLFPMFFGTTPPIMARWTTGPLAFCYMIVVIVLALLTHGTDACKLHELSKTCHVCLVVKDTSHHGISGFGNKSVARQGGIQCLELLHEVTLFLVFLPIGFLTGPIAITGSFAGRTLDEVCVVVRHRRHAMDATHTRKGSLDGKNSFSDVHNG
jgi:hypothetical protein